MLTAKYFSTFSASTDWIVTIRNLTREGKEYQHGRAFGEKRDLLHDLDLPVTIAPVWNIKKF